VLATAATSATKSEGTSQIAKLTGASRHHLTELLASAQTGTPASPSAYADHPALQAARVVQAHGSSHAFLVAAILGVVAVIAAIGLIQVKKADVASVSELALAAA
jgi:hypothetical protein